MMHCRQVELKYVGCCDKRTDNETDTGMRRLIYVSASYRRNVIVFVKPENEGRENEVWRMRYGVKILVWGKMRSFRSGEYEYVKQDERKRCHKT